MEKMAHFFSFRSSKKTWIVLSLILLVAAVLRFYRIEDFLVFLGDEGRDALVVYNILHGKLTLLGPTSSVGGFFLGPVYYYFIAPFLWLFNYNPVGPAVMVAIIGVLTVLLVYKVGEEFFNSKVGLIASVLYAVSPIVVLYSRSSWNPNVMPFFSLLTLYSLYKAVEKNSKKLFLLSGLFFGITMQLHYLATFLGVIIFLYVLFTKSGRLLELVKRYVLIFLGFIIGFSPFLLFELRHGFTNTGNIVRFVIDSPETGAGGQTLTNVWNVFVRLFGGLVISFPESKNFKMFSGDLINAWLLSSIILGICAIAIFLLHFLSNLKDRAQYRKLLLLLLWGLTGVLLFGFYNKPIYDYYLGFMFPLPFLLVGFLIYYVSEKIAYGKLFALGVVTALVLISLKFNPAFGPANKQLEQTKVISEFVLSKTGGRPFNFAILTGGNSDHAYRYFFRLNDKDPVVIQFPGIDPQRRTVTDQLFVVCESKPCSPQGESLWEIAGFGRAEIDGEWDVSVVKIYRLVHYRGE